MSRFETGPRDVGLRCKTGAGRPPGCRSGRGAAEVNRVQTIPLAAVWDDGYTRPRHQRHRSATMRRPLAYLIGFAILAITPAQAQGAPAAAGEFPWMWVIVIVIAIAAAIWWYMTRIRSRT